MVPPRRRWRRRTPGWRRTAGGSACSSAALDAGRRRDLRDDEPRHRQAAGHARAGHRRRCDGRCARRGRRCRRGGRSAATCAPAICTPSPARCRSTAASSPCSRRSTTASRSARSRDIDIPLVARHFYYHAGWAQLMEQRAARLRAAGRGRPDHPLELPAADAGLEDRARAGDGQHGRAQARRVHPADRARLRRDLRGGRPAAGRGQHRHRRRPQVGEALVSHPDVDKIAFTGSTEVGRHHPQGHGGQRQDASRSNWAANRRSSSSTTPTWTAWSRAWWTRSGSTRARSAAPGRACWCRRASPTG